MKEAAGEANMTVITIILIGIIAAIAIPLVRNAMVSSNQKGCCNNAGGVWEGGTCTGTSSVMTEYQSCIDGSTNID